MAQRGFGRLSSSAIWKCQRCRNCRSPFTSLLADRHFTTSTTRRAEEQIVAAPEINFSDAGAIPARVIPASPSYFSTSPKFNDNILSLQRMVEKYQSLPTLSPDQTPRTAFMRLIQYRSTTGERISASKYARVLVLLSRLNKIPENLRSQEVHQVLRQFERPGAAKAPKAKVGHIDEFGRSVGVGRRKESSARVYLVEGTGEVLINGKSIVQAFPRMHDRESALWPLKISERTDKYNVFALVEGGGVTGQAESVTLALAKALLVQEPALKPALRRAGCVTFDARRVERKKPGHRKARKMPAWVKR